MQVERRRGKGHYERSKGHRYERSKGLTARNKKLVEAIRSYRL